MFEVYLRGTKIATVETAEEITETFQAWVDLPSRTIVLL